jgi:GTP cyclohydrolase I
MKTSEHLSTAIADVQGQPDSRELVINHVGIKNIRHPLIVQQADGKLQHTIAECNLYTSLAAEQKGTHMSRFVELLNNDSAPVTPENLIKLVEKMTQYLGSDRGYIEFKFPYFRNKAAPVSGVTSLLDYEICIVVESSRKHTQINLQVISPVTSLCPCSKEISRYGAHNQRSHVSITVFDIKDLWIEDLILIAEQEASCELYGILKRSDEKYITEKAYENPKFVEDIVRDIAAVLNSDKRVKRYHITAENFESIHNHSAFAEIVR